VAIDNFNAGTEVEARDERIRLLRKSSWLLNLSTLLRILGFMFRLAEIGCLIAAVVFLMLFQNWTVAVWMAVIWGAVFIAAKLCDRWEPRVKDQSIAAANRYAFLTIETGNR
jgi:hypothetical protein